uniref:hypothetical protein n=1 Tax=Clavibacter michiganensis TaxID=28447 RepID=UPI00292F625D
RKLDRVTPDADVPTPAYDPSELDVKVTGGTVRGLRGAGEVQLVGDGGEVPEGGRVGVHGSPLDGPLGGGARSGGGSDPG